MLIVGAVLTVGARGSTVARIAAATAEQVCEVAQAARAYAVRLEVSRTLIRTLHTTTQERR